ncbi:DUF3263 domain-containing protein [Corynebacterium heidelbergense]|uniref:DUF3263 domain-containing protein n=2 Tax=Corynebacterium heidelbergense TaxID=2055947 RepID=A0A364VC16_9CORY|nr:DUF3263 domain-containing protein [Corynebacterium heidelbergense]RAV34195.1 DUF3263 domain-containing protein [Corynebacterium heidelbergense]
MLSAEDKRMLAFERQWWLQRGAKNERIREEFHMEPVRYFQILNALIERPEALEHDPVLVRTLLRRREGER